MYPFVFYSPPSGTIIVFFVLSVGSHSSPTAININPLRGFYIPSQLRFINGGLKYNPSFDEVCS
jgi:hypothetical protein